MKSKIPTNLQSKIRNPQSEALRILILEDVPTDVELVKRGLKKAEIAFTSRHVETRDSFLKELEDFSPDLVLSDYSMPQFNGMEALELVKERHPSIPLIMVTGSMNEDTAVECMKAGAVDYVIKENLTRLGQAVVGALKKKKLKEQKEKTDKALRESEEKYRDIFENVSDFIYIHDLEGYFTETNLAFIAAYGYGEDDLANLTLRDIIPERYKHQFEDYLKEIIEKGQSEGLMRIVTKDGDERIVEYKNALVYDKTGPIGVRGSARDITERRKAELALRESEERYRTVLEANPDPVVVYDIKGNVIYFNPAFTHVFGWTFEERIGKKMDDFVPEKNWPETEMMIDKVLAGESFSGIESLRYTKEGNIIPVSISGSAYRDQEDKPVGSVVNLRDITEQKRAEEKINEYSKNLEHMVEERTRELNRALYDTEESRDRIDAILKSIADGLIVTDIYNRIILMNRAAEDLLNVRFSEVIEQPIDFAIQDKTLRDRIKSTLEKRKTDYQFDFELPGEDIKHPLIMSARTSGIKDKAGNHTGIINIIHDVTLEREVDRMKTEFISTAAHELRTPLTSIQGFSEILLNRDDINKKERNKFLAYINDQSENLANIINDLLDISRIESGLGYSLNKVPCDMADIIRGVVPQFEAPNSGHHFEVILPEESVELEADKEKMEQVLQNLLSNAVKYSPEGGTICLSAKKIADSAIEISIADQGIGMTPEQMEKIFDKFYRADASDTAIEGTGLGMSIVKFIVEAHGGKVWVESEFGKGTTVKFVIPI